MIIQQNLYTHDFCNTLRVLQLNNNSFGFLGVCNNIFDTNNNKNQKNNNNNNNNNCNE